MPTIKEVAEASGVSTTTVSFVLNNSRAVGPEARARVLRAAREMGYTPNPLARALSSGRSHTLGVLMPDLRSVITTSILSGIDEAARTRGYKILPALHYQNPADALSSLSDLSARRMDALISLSPFTDEHPEIVSALPSAQLPFVLGHYRAAPGMPVDSVLVDHKQGAHLAVSHLLDKGCRTIAFIGGPPDREATRERLAGWRDAHKERGLVPPEDLVTYGNFVIHHALEAAHKLMAIAKARPASLPPIDGVFGASDIIAAAGVRVLRENGLRVPHDVRVIGFNNQDLCEAVDPPLSTVQSPLKEIGAKCVERIIFRLEEPENWRPQTITLPCQLVLRDSA